MSIPTVIGILYKRSIEPINITIFCKEQSTGYVSIFRKRLDVILNIFFLCRSEVSIKYISCKVYVT